MYNIQKVSISKGNVKMGGIPSVSVPVGITCADCTRGTCLKKCYAARMARLYKSVGQAWARNLEIYREDPAAYFGQVMGAAFTTRYFRWHVGGDIVDKAYFEGMVDVARKCTGTTFLAFTKKYGIINDWIADNGDLPENLRVIFSAWGDMIDVPNPHGLPVSQVIFKGQEPREDWKVCGGNCTECACRGVGCWELKKGETIAFYEH